MSKSPSMQNLIFKVGNADVMDAMNSLAMNQPFAENVIRFLDDLSKTLIRNKFAKQYPDVISFAFWCRRASVIAMQDRFQNNNENQILLGRGVVFHIAPSNVAVNFAYSLVSSLLAGNANIVRLPSKSFEQVNLICDGINEALNENVTMRGFFVLVRYGHDQAITDAISQCCNVRIIWGGNQTIDTIRRSPLKPRATEICFADRYSISIIDSDAYLSISDKNVIAQHFFNDTYLTDQNACTSPKLIVWMGSKIALAQDLFWNKLHEYLLNNYEMQPIQAVDKLEKVYLFAALNQKEYNLKLSKVEKDNLITRISIEKLSKDIFEFSGNSGLFFEYQARELSEILSICDESLQTVSTLGVSKNDIREFVINYKPHGIDRIVEIGKTLDFDLVWDGYNLITQLSRVVVY